MLRRDAHVVYRNGLGPDGEWTAEPGTAAAVAAERDRPRTAEETYQFANSVRRTEELIDALPQADRVEPAAELETAVTLARPILDPGVDVDRAAGREDAAKAVERAIGREDAAKAVERAIEALDARQAAERERDEEYHRQRERYDPGFEMG